jgi:hypothetical protein
MGDFNQKKDLVSDINTLLKTNKHQKFGNKIYLQNHINTVKNKKQSEYYKIIKKNKWPKRTRFIST